MRDMGLTWRRSSFSSDHGDECVELAAVPGAVAVRDSKHPEAGHLTLDRATLRKVVMASTRR